MREIKKINPRMLVYVSKIAEFNSKTSDFDMTATLLQNSLSYCDYIFDAVRKFESPS